VYKIQTTLTYYNEVEKRNQKMKGRTTEKGKDPERKNK